MGSSRRMVLDWLRQNLLSAKNDLNEPGKYNQRSHRPNYMIALYAGLLMMVGLIVMYAIGPQRAELLNSLYNTDNYSSNYFFIRQVQYTLLAIFFVISMMFVPLKLLRDKSGWVLLLAIATSLILFLFGNVMEVSYGMENSLADCKLGACRWIKVGPVSFQPAEFLKFGVLLFLSRFMAEKIQQGKINNLKESIIPVLLITVFVGMLVVFFQKDLGTGVALLAIIGSMWAVSGLSIKNSSIMLAGLALVMILSVALAPHRMARIETFLKGDEVSSSDKSSDSATYHARQARMALGSGYLFGVGIGNSVQAAGYLPEAINDSVFAIVGETFGFIGAVILILIFTALLWQIISMAKMLPDAWHKMIVAGVFGWLSAHVVINIASMTGVFPLTGITLPFLSFGGTSMVFVALAIGLVLHVSRYTIHKQIGEEVTHESIHGRRRVGRTRYSNSSRSK